MDCYHIFLILYPLSWHGIAMILGERMATTAKYVLSHRMANICAVIVKAMNTRTSQTFLMSLWNCYSTLSLLTFNFLWVKINVIFSYFSSLILKVALKLRPVVSNKLKCDVDVSLLETLPSQLRTSCFRFLDLPSAFSFFLLICFWTTSVWKSKWQKTFLPFIPKLSPVVRTRLQCTHAKQLRWKTQSRARITISVQSIVCEHAAHLLLP